MPRSAPARTAGLVLLVALLAGGAGTSGFLLTREARRPAGPTLPTPPPVPAAVGSALAGVTAPPPSVAPGDTAAPARAAAVAARLAPLVADPALGGRLLARVVDARTGTVLFDRGGSTAAAPASTAKLVTAAAVLSVHAPSDRFRTSVVDAGGGTIVIVGGGDPTLTAARPGQSPAYPDAARLSDLAAQVREKRETIGRIVVDGSLFTGPSVSPDWDPEDVPTSYAAPITALMVDGGRAAPGDVVRSAAPDLAAGHALAAALGRPDLPVVRGTAPAAARTIATVESAPLGTLLEQMLQASDNVLAECLARQVAVATHRPASFTGAAAAARAVLAGHGVQVGGGLRDGSGLSAADRITPAALAAVLRFAVAGEVPAVRELLTGLPVAAWSGTLADRYLRGTPTGPGAGVVRAKTGTLTAVSSLAGVVHDRDGRLLVFALLADRVAPGYAPTKAADAALDAVATRLAACGCS